MAKPQRDNETAARALIDAIFSDDATACRAHGITRRTLQRWRAQLGDDVELSQAFNEHLQIVNRESWGEQVNAAIVDMIQSTKASLASLESQAITREEHIQLLELKMRFLQMLLEPALTREMLSGASEPVTR